MTTQTKNKGLEYYPLDICAHGNPNIENPFHEDALKWCVIDSRTRKVLSDDWLTSAFAWHMMVSIYNTHYNLGDNTVISDEGC